MGNWKFHINLRLFVAQKVKWEHHILSNFLKYACLVIGTLIDHLQKCLILT
jgi:hypothetical protein